MLDMTNLLPSSDLRHDQTDVTSSSSNDNVTLSLMSLIGSISMLFGFLGKIVTLGSFATLITSSLITLGVLLINTQLAKPNLNIDIVFIVILPRPLTFLETLGQSKCHDL